MHPTGTHIAYLHLCHRKLWLFANGLNMEQQSVLVAEGKQIDEQSYSQRADRWQELAIEGIKIDHYDAVRGIVREVKKSRKREDAHLAQLKYYLFVLERNEVAVSHGLLEYPKLRQSEEVYLTDEDRQTIPLWEAEVLRIIDLPACPALVKKGICKRCAYYEFCYVEE
ncbi:MAG: CRISPR-associated protein Cas4 [Saprospiraceae bacterium]|nr:MAG: CRISPR-associated protein Cas4 [Saprospiraceae bacterium]